MWMVGTQWKVNQVLSESWKTRGEQNQIRQLIFDEENIDKDFKILRKFRRFYQTLFKNYSPKKVIEI